MTLAGKAAKCATAAVLSFGLIFAIGCGDVYRPIATPITQPGGDPQGREVDAVINQNPAANAPGSATYIDVSGDANVGNRSAGIGVTRASFDSAASGLYIPNPGSNNVTFILQIFTSAGPNTSTANITVSAGSNPTAVFPGGSSMYTLNHGNTPDCPATGSVGVIDTVTQTLTQDVCVGASPSWATYATSQSLLFVLDSAANSVYVIYAPQNTIKAVLPVGTSPVWASLTMDGKYLLVLNQGSNDISVIDVNALTVAATTTPTGGSAPVYGYIDAKLNRLYVVNQGSETLSAFDASNPLALASLHTPVAVGAVPTRVSGTADGERVFVPNTGSNTVTAVQTGSFATKTIQVSTDSTVHVTDAAVTKDGTKLFVTTVSSDDTKNQTTIIRTTDDVIVNALPAPLQDMSTCEPSTTTCTTKRQRPMQIAGTR